MNKIDAFLNKATMYRLVLYGLLAIVITALVLSAVNILHYSLLSLFGSLGVLLVSGLVFHYLLRWAFKSGTSVESWWITTLILFLILRPAEDISEYAVLVFAVALAMASKYILAFANRHIFNPAAIALVILGLLGSGQVFWWVGSDVLLPIVLLVALLIIRKTRRFAMVSVFTMVALVTFAISNSMGWQPSDIFRSLILSGPLVFFAAVMLTEPATTPPQRYLRLIYGAIVGVLYSVQFSYGPFYASPELALVAGNLFAYLVSMKRRYKLTLLSQAPQGGGIYEFTFNLDGPLRYKPGQYLEWTLPHHNPDSRGNRRYFTIASSPEEGTVKLGIRIDPEHSSSFKRALLALQPGKFIWASQLSGDFVLPRSVDRKLVFIAGGVGITPFRSMIKHIVDTGKWRDITLFYSAQTADGFAYWQLFNESMQNGIRPNYLFTGNEVPAEWTGLTGFLTPEILQSTTPDYKKSLFFISGPNAMVANYKKMLIAAGVPRRHIKTDYFPGF